MIRPDPLLKVYELKSLPQIASSPRIATPFPNPKGSQCTIFATLFSTLLGPR
jgi:hypothetical protein